MIVAELFAKLGLIPDEASFTKGEKLIEHLHTALEAYIGYEIIKGVGEMVMGVVELGSKLNDTAQKTGIAVDQLQFLGYVAKLNSSSMDSATHAVQRLSRGFDEAASKGGGKVATALQQLHLNMSELQKLPVDQRLEKIAQQISKLPDGAHKTAIAMSLFGRSGAELIPTLNDLGKNGAQLREEFEEMGGGLSKEQTEALDNFGDDVDRVKVQLGLFKAQIVADLLPALQEMLHGFLEWIGHNRQLVESTIITVVEGLALALKGLAAVMEVVIGIIDFFRQNIEVAQDLLIALGAVITIFSLQAAAAWIIAFAPLLLVIGVIALLVAAIRKAYDWIKNGTGPIHDAFMGVVHAMEYVAETVIGYGERVYKFFSEDVPGAIKHAWDALVDWIQTKIDEFVTAIQSNKVLRGLMALAGGSTQLELIDQLHPINGAPTVAEAPSGTTNIQTGDVSVTVNPSPGMDEKAVGEAAADAAKKVLGDHIRQTVESVKGGRR